MYLKTLVAGLVLALVAFEPAHAQRGGPAVGNWELIAEEKVSFGRDHDIITLNNDDNHWRAKAYRKLRFVATGGEVRMRSIRLVFMNGYAEDYNFNQNLKPGQEIDIDLRGERSYLRHIHMNYQSKIGISIGGGGIRLSQAKIRVLGYNVGVAPPPVARPSPPPPRGRPASVAGWSELDLQRFNRRDDSVVMPVGRREGAVSQILLRSEDDTVEVKDIEIIFGNGQRQAVRINQRLDYGQSTRPIDLEGDRRFIQRVIVNLDGARRPGDAVLALFGKDVPKGPVIPRGWESLGTERVGRGDSDVEFRVGRREGRFGMLRLLADGERMRIDEVRVRFGNGSTQTIRVNESLSDGEMSRPFNLEGDTRFIDRVTVILERRGRPTRGEIVLLGSEQAAPDRDRDRGRGGELIPLGEATVGRRVDREVIRVGQNEEWFRNRGFDRLRFVAERHDVHLMSARVVYLNGVTEDYQVDRNIQEGSFIAVDLRGRRSYVREIEMLYRKASGRRGDAVVKVYGETAAGRR